MSTHTISKESIIVTFGNGITLNLSLSAERNVLGLGAAELHGLPLRNERVLLAPHLRTIHGVAYHHFHFESVEERIDQSIAIHTTAIGVSEHSSPYGDQYNDHLFLVGESKTAKEGSLTWIFRPESLVLDDEIYQGFSYSWTFDLGEEKIHHLIAHTSWEIGGKASGNTILSLGQVTPATYTAEPATHFTSACLQSLLRFGDPTAMSFQFCPRYGVHQCFDFLAHEEGTLLGYWQGKNDTRSFVQKNPNEETIFIIDAEHWKARSTGTTSPKSILFCPAPEGGMKRHVERNRWYHAHEYTSTSIRNHFGLKRSTPKMERTLPYAQRVTQKHSLEMRVGETWVDSREWLIAMADEMLPNIAKQGIKRVIPESIVESDPTERGFLTKLEAHGLHNDLNVGSVCCVHRYRPAELFGGMKGWRYFCDKAHSLGLEAGHWVGPHLAYNAPIFQEQPAWMLRGFNTLSFSGGYPNFELACLNWNTGVRQWIFEDLRRMREEGGLDYIWFDSLANLGMIPVDYSKEMETNTYPILEFMADLQKIGIKDIAVEGMCPAAMSGAHLMDHEPDHDGGVQWIAGQNSWLWYEKNEDMIPGQQPRTWVHKDRSEENVRERLFRCLANNTTPELTRYTPVFGEPVPWVKDSLATFEAVQPYMQSRTVLPEEQGILWTGPGGKILFAYKPFDFTVENEASVMRILSGREEAVSVRGSLAAEREKVYRIR